MRNNGTGSIGRAGREIEGLLGGNGVPVATLRVGIIVGYGGVSWEMTRQLSSNTYRP